MVTLDCQDYRLCPPCGRPGIVAASSEVRLEKIGLLDLRHREWTCPVDPEDGRTLTAKNLCAAAYALDV